ncbi:MAG: TonB-dependent receptor, partial [Bacteroidaceae bacterium]|nr:TonB-dependent receptor [Bacteroidaceae bacterium]
THRYFSSPISFKRTPTLRLTFSPSPSSKGEGVMLQTAQSSTLTMNIHSSFTIPFGKTFRLQLPVALNAMYDDLETIYSPPSQGGVGGGSINDIHGWALNPTLNPGFDIHSRNRRFYLSAGLGAALKGLYYNRINYTKLVLNPSVGINYTFSANSKWSFSSGYSTQIGDMMTLLTEPMQVNYRTVRTSSGIIGESNTWHTSSDWKWQLPLQYFTLSIGASHSEDKRNTLNSQHIDGIDISSSALLRDTRSRTTSFTFASTKNFPSLLTKLGVDANYSFGDSEQAVNADIIKVRSNNYNVHGNSTFSPITWLELRYDIRYGWSQSRYADSKNITTSLTHSGAIHVFPIAVLDLSFNYDHVRRQISSDQYKHMSLFNASAQYKFKRLVLRLELDNLLNQRHYTYTIFDGINTYTYDYTLCGRTIMLRATFKL